MIGWTRQIVEPPARVHDEVRHAPRVGEDPGALPAAAPGSHDVAEAREPEAGVVGSERAAAQPVPNVTSPGSCRRMPT